MWSCSGGWRGYGRKLSAECVFTYAKEIVYGFPGYYLVEKSLVLAQVCHIHYPPYHT